MKYVIYYRVSTQKQGRSGLGLDAQRKAVQQFLSSKGIITIPIEFTDFESGKRSSRPQLIKAIEYCKKDDATLLIAKLDRLSRDVKFIFDLKESGVQFHALDLPEANTLTLGIMSSLAQFESELISTRTKAALRAKKERDPQWKPGRNNLTDKGREKGREKIMKNARDNTATRHGWHYIKPRLEQGLTYQEICDGLNSEGYVTRTGKKFYPATVRAIWLKYYNEKSTKPILS